MASEFAPLEVFTDRKFAVKFPTAGNCSLTSDGHKPRKLIKAALCISDVRVGWGGESLGTIVVTSDPVPVGSDVTSLKLCFRSFHPLSLFSSRASL